MAEIKIVTPQLGGLRLIHSDTAEFDQQSEVLHGENAGLVANLKPYIVMLSNQSAHKVIGYTILPRVIRSDRDAYEHPCRYTFPEVAGVHPSFPRGREIFPGEKRFVTLDCWELGENDEDLAFFLRQHANVHKHTYPETVMRVEVRLDAILYEDGELVGPDTRKLGEKFIELLRDKRELYRELLDSPDPLKRLRSLFEDAHYNLYLHGSGMEGSENLPPFEELLKRQAEIPELRQLSITDTNLLRMAFGGVRLIEAMEAALQNEELVIHRKASD